VDALRVAERQARIKLGRKPQAGDALVDQPDLASAREGARVPLEADDDGSVEALESLLQTYRVATPVPRLKRARRGD
jgi:hypothetical protein